jgi:hypothetical protein
MSQTQQLIPQLIMFLYAIGYLDLPTSVASGLDAVSTPALLVITVLGLRLMISLFSQFFTSTPRNS